MELIIEIGDTGWGLDLVLLMLSVAYIYYVWHVSHHRDYICVEDIFKQNKRIEKKLGKLERLIISGFDHRNN